MLNVTADTNIYISALQFGGTARQFLNLARNDAFRLAISDTLLDEMSGVLRLKFGWTTQMVDEAVVRLSRFTIRASSGQTLRVIEADPDDDRVLECAVAAGSNFIVTGDRHLLSLGYYEQIQIVRLSEFMKLLPPA